MIPVLQRSIYIFVEVIQLLILARIFLSFIMRDPTHPVMRTIYSLTEPILAPFRSIISSLNLNTGMFDFSPLLAMFGIQILASIITRILGML